MGQESVAVVIPCFNTADYVGKAIESALSQTWPVSRIVVVDDGSTDDSRARIAAFGNRIEFIPQENRGVSAARNRGLARLTTKFVIFLDADDVLYPDAVATGVRYLQEDPMRPFVFGSVNLIDAAGMQIKVQQLQKRLVRRSDVMLGAVPSPSQVMFRVDDVAAAGGFNERIRLGEDFDLYLRLTRRSPAYCHGETVAAYRLHPGQATRQPAKSMKSMLAIIDAQPVDEPTDPADLRRARRHWQRYYGQFIPTGVLRSLRKGEFAHALQGVGLFLAYSPETIPGAASFLRRRLRRR